MGGWGLSVPTEALAKFGQLYLQQGKWNGRQLLPAKWVAEATSFKIQQPVPAKPSRPQEKNDWQQGYGYQFWRSQNKSFRGDGAFGQFTIVLPEQDAVIAMNAEASNMQGILDLVWEHLLPALKPQPLPADPAGQGTLQKTLASLALPLAQGKVSSPTTARLSGKTFQFDANDLGLKSAAFQFGKKESCSLTLRTAQGEHDLHAGLGQWVRGETSLPGTPPRYISGGASKPGTPFKVAVSAAWADDNTLEWIVRYYETAHYDVVTCRFDGGRVQVSFLNSIAKQRGGKDSRPLLQGRMG